MRSALQVKGVKLAAYCPYCYLPLYAYQATARCKNCDYFEELPADIEALREQRPRLPGFETYSVEKE